MKRAACLCVFGAALLVAASAMWRPASATPQHAPFTATLSNTTPLVFGMSAAQAALALGVPLEYVAGRPGDEMFVAPRPGGGGYIPRDDRLYLQFRNGRLTGWKGDWGKSWMRR